MDKERLHDLYWQNLDNILNRGFVDEAQYRGLIQKKIAAENALKAIASDEVWKSYFTLDAICNELETVRQEAAYLAGAADYEKTIR